MGRLLVGGALLVITCGAFYCNEKPRELPDIGAACGADDAGACNSDLFCEVDAPGGYCTVDCTTPGSTR